MISLCIIAKNNEDIIERCINSAKKIAGEIILVDTGSDDKTKEIAEKCGAKVYDFEWNDNFSEARNYANSKASGKWILSLDSDEVIAEKDLDKVKNLIKNEEYFGYYLIQRNYTDKIGAFGWTSCKDDFYEESAIANGFVPRAMLRLFKNDKRIRFEGAVHESVAPSIEKTGGKISSSDVAIHHYGSLHETEEKKRWYIDIEMKNPNKNFYDEYQIGAQMHELGNLKQAMEHLTKSLQLNQQFYLTWLEIATILMQNGKISEVKPILLQSLKLNEYEMTWNNLGIAEAYEGNTEKAIECFKKSININPKNADFYFNLSQALKQNKKLIESKEAMEKAIYLNPVYEKYRDKQLQ